MNIFRIHLTSILLTRNKIRKYQSQSSSRRSSFHISSTMVQQGHTGSLFEFFFISFLYVYIYLCICVIFKVRFVFVFYFIQFKLVSSNIRKVKWLLQ